MSVQIRHCPHCFARPCNGLDYVALVPHPDGGYTKHKTASFYTDAHDRDCEWQKKDTADRVARLRNGG